MRQIYMSVQITNYGTKSMKPDCFFFNVDENDKLISKEISYDEARRLMWELKLAGGEKEVRTNYLCPNINYRKVVYHMIIWD